MMRFITGQYGKRARSGGMIGYVVDGRIAHAIANVMRNIRTQHVALGMTPPGELLLSTILPADPRARETHHTRQHDPAPFRIHHLFTSSSAVPNGRATTRAPSSAPGTNSSVAAKSPSGTSGTIRLDISAVFTTRHDRRCFLPSCTRSRS
jgi:hypothetical protein